MPFNIKSSVHLALVLVVAALVLAACGSADDSDTDEADAPATASPTAGNVVALTETNAGAATPSIEEVGASPTMNHGMTESDMMAVADPDLLFIDGMIVHHASAVAMAEVAREAAEHEEIKQLAGEIIAAQQQEIEQLEQWRSEWYPDAPESDLSGMMDMAGMAMSAADMQMLREVADFDKMFIDMMIPHHESAIEMAHALQETTERPELRELTSNIIKTQQTEIDQMREWRDAWYGAS